MSAASRNLDRLRAEGEVSLMASLITACCVPQRTVTKFRRRSERPVVGSWAGAVEIGLEGLEGLGA